MNDYFRSMIRDLEYQLYPIGFSRCPLRHQPLSSKDNDSIHDPKKHGQTHETLFTFKLHS